MKLSFSTLGCPDFDWSDIYSVAKDFGFDGIEMRGLGDKIFSVHAKPFSKEGLPGTLKLLKKLKLEIPCLSSGCCLADKEKAEENQKELKEYIDLAAKLGSSYIRILGDYTAEPRAEVDDEFVLEQLKRLIPYAEERGVTLLLETNGVYTDTARLARLLARAQSDYIGALWDVHHPFRFAGEAPEKTVQNLGAFIKFTHFKDSVMQDGKVCYRMMGEGDLPIDEIMLALSSINYEGYLSLEAQALRPRPYGPRHSLPPLCQLHGTLHKEGQGEDPPLRQPKRHGQVHLGKGDAHRPNLPSGPGPRGRGVPGPDSLQLHHARLHPHLRRV